MTRSHASEPVVPAARTFAEVFRFEIAHRLGQWATWFYLAAMIAATWLVLVDIMLGEAAGTGAIHANAPANIATSMILGTMMMLVATAGLFGEAAARDLATGMHPLVFTAPLSKSGYLGGRFAGAFVINAVVLLAGAIGIALVELHRASQPELFGAFRPIAYIAPYFVFALPTMFATGAIIFAVAALTGRTVASYGAAVFLFFASSIGGRMFSARILGILADPFGLAAVDAVTEYWTPSRPTPIWCRCRARCCGTASCGSASARRRSQ